MLLASHGGQLAFFEFLKIIRPLCTFLSQREQRDQQTFLSWILHLVPQFLKTPVQDLLKAIPGGSNLATMLVGPFSMLLLYCHVMV